MITQDAERVQIDLDENVTDEMLRAMADGLRTIQGGGIIRSLYKPYCIGGCRLAWREETDHWVHAKDCPLAQAMGVAHLCPEVLKNLALVEGCLEMAAQEAEHEYDAFLCGQGYTFQTPETDADGYLNARVRPRVPIRSDPPPLRT